MGARSLADRAGAPALFANRFEAAAFWACVVGLVVALALAVPRWRAAPPASAALEAQLADQARQLAELRAELAATQAVLDSLRTP